MIKSITNIFSGNYFLSWNGWKKSLNHAWTGWRKWSIWDQWGNRCTKLAANGHIIGREVKWGKSQQMYTMTVYPRDMDMFWWVSLYSESLALIILWTGVLICQYVFRQKSNTDMIYNSQKIQSVTEQKDVYSKYFWENWPFLIGT